MKGEISSITPIDIYFLDEINFDKWDRDKTYEPKDCNEGVLEANVDYEATKKGIWYIVIENNGRKSATVKVNMFFEEGSPSELLFP